MILGVDPRARRVGVALADEATGVAVPLETIDLARSDVVARVGQLVARHDVSRVVVGRPVGLSGAPGPAAEAAAELVARLRAALDVEVTEYDERFTSVAAERSLAVRGTPARARRATVDALAAQVMLQGFVDSQRR